MYQPTLGRFTARDPLPENGVLVGGIPQSSYWYANNNPVNMTDPSGLQAQGPAVAEKQFDLLLAQVDDDDFFARELGTTSLIEFLIRNGVAKFCTLNTLNGLSPEAKWRYRKACVEAWKQPYFQRITKPYVVEICCGPNDGVPELSRRLLSKLKTAIDANSLPFNISQKVLDYTLHSGELFADDLKALEAVPIVDSGLTPGNLTAGERTLVLNHLDGLEAIRRACKANLMIRVQMKFAQFPTPAKVGENPKWALSYDKLELTDTCCPAIAEKPKQ